VYRGCTTHTPPDVFARPVFARARRLCLAMPETTEKSSWGHPNFRAGDRTFCAFEMIKGRPSLAFKMPAAEIERLLVREDAFATPYGRGRWISLWMDGQVDWAVVRQCVDSSYRTVAKKRMLDVLKARRRA
jgi:predicted DNA-binding protein (MmcQ/YjbR family)